MDKQNLMDQEAAVQLYNTLCERKDLMTVLANMQMEKGIPAEKADENAKALVRMVSDREILFDQVSENRNAALEGVLNKFAKKKPEKRKEMLHRLYFGLSLHQDPELNRRVQDGASIEWLFQSYYAQYGNDPKMTAEALEQKIRALVADFHLSPQTLRAYAGMAKRGDALAAGAALGEEGKQFKCVAAMDLYLRNQDTMTMEEAVNTACTNAEILAAADACSCGMLTEDQVNALLAVASLVCCFLCFSSFGDVLTLQGRIAEIDTMDMSEYAIEKLTELNDQKLQSIWACLAAVAGAIGLDVLSPKISQWCGKLATKQRFTRSLEESEAAQVLNTLADHAERQKEAALPREDHDRQKEEARRQAFEREREEAAKARRMQTFR